MESDPSPIPSLAAKLAKLTGVALAAALGAGALAALLVAWLPVAPWSGPVAAALVAALVVPALVWRSLQNIRPAPGADVTDDGLYDRETGAFRRAPFLVLAQREWMRSARYGGAVAMLLIEVDRLRVMTDRAGPQIADPLLSGLVEQVTKGLRGADILARFDAAQLAVFLPESDPTGALDVADRIRENVEKLSMPGLPVEALLTASIGVALLRPQNHSLEALLADVEAALATAREAGGNCVRMAPVDRRRPGQTGAAPGGKAAKRKGE